ncbi:MAG: gamma-glutamyltranspeptidase [Phycisphaerales bacterium]|nr:gamma-glutamyltranspeptidase [Phycisphaerales bacterium]
MGLPLASYRSVIVTAHRDAGAAGVASYKQGGNAIDAAVAAAMVLCVVSPINVGLGGYGGTMVVYSGKTGRVRALDFDSRAPRAFRPELYADPKVAQHGYLAVGVPAVVAGLDAALKRFGTLDWGGVSTHAADLAENGFAIPAALASAFKSWAATGDKTSLEAIFPDRKIPTTGQIWRQPDLAKLIRALAADPRAFYTGKIAKQIVRQVQANGGLLAEEDFARYEVQETDPLKISYRGHDLFTPPPPSGGVTTLSILKTLENFDLPRYERWDGPYFDLFVEAAKLCWQDRVRWLGDPDFVKVPADDLLSAKAAAERAGRIRSGDTTPPLNLPAPPAGEHTVNVVAADAAGNCCSITLTHGETFGSHVAIAGTGLFLGHGMSRFDYAPRHPNAPQPGKRMHHNMSPLLIFKNDKPLFALGMPGGTKIVTVTAQLAISLLDFGATPLEAARAPRVHVEAAEPIQTAASVGEPIAGELELMNHRVKRVPALGGPANIARIDPANHTITGACSAGSDGVDGIQ